MRLRVRGEVQGEIGSWQGAGKDARLFQGQRRCNRRGGHGMSSSTRSRGADQFRNYVGGRRLSGSLSLRISLRTELFRLGRDLALEA